MTPGLVVLIAGVVVAAALVGIGASRVVSLALALKKRVQAYGALPVLALAKTTGPRVSLTAERAADLPGLLARGSAAAAAIGTASADLRAAAAAVPDIAGGYVMGALRAAAAALPTSRRRTTDS